MPVQFSRAFNFRTYLTRIKLRGNSLPGGARSRSAPQFISLVLKKLTTNACLLSEVSEKVIICMAGEALNFLGSFYDIANQRASIGFESWVVLSGTLCVQHRHRRYLLLQ
jgi:hypothetical protein